MFSHLELVKSELLVVKALRPSLVSLCDPQCGTPVCIGTLAVCSWVRWVFQERATLLWLRQVGQTLVCQRCKIHLTKEQGAVIVYILQVCGVKARQAPDFVLSPASDWLGCTGLGEPSQDAPCPAVWAPTDQGYQALHGHGAEQLYGMSDNMSWPHRPVSLRMSRARIMGDISG